jgi:SMC interacting uncharacterized protein involved in chromosome segregation
MSKDDVIDAESREVLSPSHKPLAEELRPVTKAVRETLRAVGETGEALVDALHNRDSVVMVRVHKDTLRQLDMLVDAEITRSRSESAAYLIAEGIKANQGLFEKIKGVTDQIEKLRTKLRETIQSQGSSEVKK